MILVYRSIHLFDGLKFRNQIELLVFRGKITQATVIRGNITQATSILKLM